MGVDYWVSGNALWSNSYSGHRITQTETIFET